MTTLQDSINEVYNLGLEKYAGDQDKAKEFTTGFLKEAFTWESVSKGAGGALGAGVVGAGLGLAVHGLSTLMADKNNSALHDKFRSVLAHVISQSSLLKNTDSSKVNAYAETVFKFAPHVACDPNLLSAALTSAAHGEVMDMTTVKALSDLEIRYIEGRKNALFTPKTYG